MPNTAGRAALRAPRAGDPPGRSRRRRRGIAGTAVALVASGTLAACGGGGSGGTPTLTWYINPDSGGQDKIAASCSDASNGAYTIETSVLPRNSDAQREQLVRRLAAGDDSIDIMSLDVVFAPELAQAGFLAPMPDDVASQVSEGVVPGALESATWNDKLVAVPFWANTQLLWYRKSVAEAAGLDMTKPVTWDQLVKAAQDQKKILSAQGRRAESLTVWFNALIESAGGHIIDKNSTDPDKIKLGFDTPAGQRAGEVMHDVATSGAVGPAFSTSSEDTSATEFESADGGFMVNWPFVYSRALAAAEAGTLDQSVPEDYGWTLYPQVDEGTPSAPPLGGINLGVSKFSHYVDQAYQATECITSDANQADYMVTNGN